MRRAVLKAAGQELLERGLERFSIAAVARRAGVHHTTIYRRWPSSSALLLEAAIEQTHERMPAQDLGSLRADLHGYFNTLLESLADPQVLGLVRSLIAGAEEPLARSRELYWRERFAVVGSIIERAVARSELRADVEPWRVIELIAGPIWMRTLLTGLPVDEILLHRAIDDALRAIA